MVKVLIVLTAASELPLAGSEVVPAGFWAQELVIPHHIFMEHGFEVHIATPRGKPAPLDLVSLDPQYHGNDVGRALNLKEQLFEIEAWQAPLSLERLALSTTDYGAVFFPGGYGPMVDLVNSGSTGNIIKRVLAKDGLIGAVCHGQATLLAARHETQWLFAGYRMTCFSPEEEKANDFALQLPWLLADRLKNEGAELSFAAPGLEHVVIDRQLYTGQNPASAGKLAWEMARKLKKLSALDKAACGVPCD
ncbi:type 1 glutamine amidotransferase domain-containing protein [Sulfurirhabdus autotrophica]|uniref:Putative intracellular protease/amidase n=1 Tax=Sulfurirhabdus autotrophica TaxID=1706046 RepID=A0A4R3Y8B4_9PROT|nr:type 1 glutamine amidotransferase domain-containing protein [Sulfurirhabdus autotrophica]TCV88090.1 putative intracellular protease/amidase [Sulfurirhabdus autotrophica]